MFRFGKSSGASSTRKKSEASSSSRRRAESIASSSSNRKSRKDDRSDVHLERSSSARRPAYTGVDDSSGRSSFVTAQDSHLGNIYETSRPQSLTESAVRTLAARDDDWEDYDGRGDARDRASSGDGRRRHRTQRSRSDSQERSITRERRENTDRQSEKSRGKRRADDQLPLDCSLESPEEQSRGYDDFNTQVDAPAFSQFPGQYEQPSLGPQPQPQHTDMSSYVQDQFPGQNPYQYSGPAFTPNQQAAGEVYGLAADYYGDQGQSVANQPGIRPESATIIHGMQPHLMPASAVPNPPQETGQGAASDFYAGTTPQFLPPVKPPNSSSTSSGKPIKPSKPSKNSTTPSSKPSKPSKLTKPSATVLATTAASAATHEYATISTQSTSQSYSQQNGTATYYQQAPTDSAFGSNPPYHQQNMTNSEPVVPSSDPYYLPPKAERPSKPGKHSSHSQSSLYAAGAAGLAAGAYGMHHHDAHQHIHQGYHQPNSGNTAQSFYGGASPPYTNGTMNGAVAMQHKHKGPISKLVDWWQDYEDIRKMEEYTEYIGICKYCFDPRSSVVDAPRKHNYDRRRSSDSMHRRSSDSLRRANTQGSKYGRIDKDSRYHSSDNERRNKKSSKASWLGAGLAGYGLAKLWENSRDFDDTYSVKSGRLSRTGSTDRKSASERGVVHGNKHHDAAYVRTRDGSVIKKQAASNASRSRSRDHDAKILGRSNERVSNGAFVRRPIGSREQSPRGASTQCRHQSRSRSHSPGLGEILGLTNSASRHDRRRSPTALSTGTSRTSDHESGGIFGGFFSQPEKKRREHRKKKKGFFTFANTSTSSSNSDLAFGSSVSKQRQPSKSGRKNISDEHLNATLLGIGATAAALTAAKRGAKQSRRQPELLVVRDTKTRKSRTGRETTSSNAQDEEDGWESASEYDYSESISSDLAFGEFDTKGKQPSRRSSLESMSSQSSGTSKWAWRWGSKSNKKHKSPSPAPIYSSRPSFASENLTGPNDRPLTAQSARRAPSRGESAMSSPTSMLPMQYVHPIPTSSPTAFEVAGTSMPGAFPLQSPITASRPGPAPIQQPQPVTPIQPSVYTTQSPSYPAYGAPSGSSAFANNTHYPLGPRRTQSSPISSHFARDTAIAGISAAATASILSNGRSKTPRDEGSAGVRFDLTEKQAKKEDRERRREQEREGDEVRRADRERAIKDEAIRQATLREEREHEQARIRLINQEAARREEGRKTEENLRGERESTEAAAWMRAQMEAEARQQEYERRKRELAAAEADVTETERRRASDLYPAHKERHEREREIEQQNVQHDENDYDKPERRERETQYPETEASSFRNAWKIPAAGIAGAGAALISDRHNERRNSRNDSSYGTNEFESAAERNNPSLADDDIYNPHVPSNTSRQADFARKAAAKVVSDMEDRYKQPAQSPAAFFAPKELFEPASGKTAMADPIGDNNVQVYRVPEINLDHPPNEPPPPYQSSPNFPSLTDAKFAHTPWGVPKLNVIGPTPPESHAGSVKGDGSPVMTAEAPVVPPQEQASTGAERRKANRVSWGQDQTRVYEVHTPDSSREQLISNQDLKDHHSSLREEIIANEDSPNSESHGARNSADGLSGASSSWARREESPVKEVIREEHLNPSRDSYSRSFVENISDPSFSLDSPGTKGASPVRGFVEGETDEPTPVPEHMPHIPGGFDDDGLENKPSDSKTSDRLDGDDGFEVPLTKKEKKKMEKTSRRPSLDRTPSTTRTESETTWAENDPEIDTSLSKKEKKKRARASLHDPLDEPDFPSLQSGSPSNDVEDDIKIPLSKKEQKKRDKAAKRDSVDSFSSPVIEATSIAPLDAAPLENDGYLLSKKDKKRDKAAKRNLAEDDSVPSTPVLDTPREEHVSVAREPEEEFFLSAKEKKRRDRAARRSLVESESEPSTPIQDQQRAHSSATLDAEEDFPLTAKEKRKHDKAAKRALLEADPESMPVLESKEALFDANDAKKRDKAEKRTLGDGEEQPTPPTPTEKSSRAFDQDDDFEVPLTKKEKKKREKKARQGFFEGLDDETSPNITPSEESTPATMQDDYSFPPTAKDERKRNKEGHNTDLGDVAAAALMGGAAAALAGPNSRSTQDSRDTEPNSEHAATPDVQERRTSSASPYDDRRASLPSNVFGDVDEWSEAKKKKKSKRNSAISHSPTASSPLRSEITWDDYVGPGAARREVRRDSDEGKQAGHSHSPERHSPRSESLQRRASEDISLPRRTSLPSPESERDARSVVSAPVERDDDRRHKSRKSRHEDDGHDASRRSRSVAASEPVDVYESSKRHKRRSKHDSGGFDDTASVVSTRSSRSRHDDDDSTKKEKKSGGILGLFRRKSSDTTTKIKEPEDRYDDREDEKKHRRHHRRKSSEREFHDDRTNSTSRSRHRDEEDRDDRESRRSSGSRHRSTHRDGSALAEDYDDTQSQVSESRRRRKHHHRDGSDGDNDTRNVDDSLDDIRSQTSESRRKHKSRHRDSEEVEDSRLLEKKSHASEDPYYGERDQSFLGERVEAEELPPLPASSPNSPTAAPESVNHQPFTILEHPGATVPDIISTPPQNPAISKESPEFDLASDRQYDDLEEALIPLPPSRPLSPIDIGSTAGLPQLPTSSSTSPTQGLHTPKRPLIPLRAISSTSVPLRFRPPPKSPDDHRGRSISFSSPLSLSPASPTTPRTRQGRPKSTEFQHSTEFRPLYLVERNSKPQENHDGEQDQLPSLPSSRTTSRSSSYQGSEEYESAVENITPDEDVAGRQLYSTMASDQAEDVLGSQQTTPRASEFPPNVFDVQSRAEPEYYSWSDMEREERLHEQGEIDAASASRPTDAPVRQSSRRDQELDQETPNSCEASTATTPETIAQPPGFQSSKESHRNAAIAALTGAAIGALAADVTTVNEDPMATDIWGNDSDPEPSSVAQDDSSDLFDRPPEPEQPSDLHKKPSKKGKKKGKAAVKLGTSSTSEPVTPASSAELRNRRRRDTEIAVDSWFNPEGAGEKAQNGNTEAHEDKNHNSTDPGLPSSTDMPLDHTDAEEPLSINLPATEAIGHDQDISDAPDSQIRDLDNVDTPASDIGPASLLLTRKKSKKDKKKQKKASAWSDESFNSSEIPTHDAQPATAETRPHDSTQTEEPLHQTDDIVPSSLAAGDERIIEQTPETSSSALFRPERRKKSKKGKKADTWADEPSQFTKSLTSNDAEVLETPPEHPSESELVVNTKESDKGKDKQTAETRADETATGPSQAQGLEPEEVLLPTSSTEHVKEQGPQEVSHSNQHTAEISTSQDVDPVQIALPEHVAEDITEPPFETMPESPFDPALGSTTDTGLSKTLPRDVPELDHDALADSGSPKQEQARSDNGEPATVDVAEGVQNNPIPTDTVEISEPEGSSFFSWLPGMGKKKSKKSSVGAASSVAVAPTEENREQQDSLASSLEPSLVAPLPTAVDVFSAELTHDRLEGEDGPATAAKNLERSAESQIAMGPRTTSDEMPLTPSPDDEWAFLPTKKSKKGRKNRNSAPTSLAVEPLATLQESEVVTPRPESVPQPGDEQLPRQELQDNTLLDTSRPESTERVDQDEWAAAPSKKSKKGNKNKNRASTAQSIDLQSLPIEEPQLAHLTPIDDVVASNEQLDSRGSEGSTVPDSAVFGAIGTAPGAGRDAAPSFQKGEDKEENQIAMSPALSQTEATVTEEGNLPPQRLEIAHDVPLPVEEITFSRDLDESAQSVQELAQSVPSPTEHVPSLQDLEEHTGLNHLAPETMPALPPEEVAVSERLDRSTDEVAENVALPSDDESPQQDQEVAEEDEPETEDVWLFTPKKGKKGKKNKRNPGSSEPFGESVTVEEEGTAESTAPIVIAEQETAEDIWAVPTKNGKKGKKNKKTVDAEKEKVDAVEPDVGPDVEDNQASKATLEPKSQNADKSSAAFGGALGIMESKATESSPQPAHEATGDVRPLRDPPTFDNEAVAEPVEDLWAVSSTRKGKKGKKGKRVLTTISPESSEPLPAAEPSINPLTQALTEPPAESSKEPSTELPTALAAEPSAEPFAERSIEPSAELSMKSSTESSIGPSTEISAEVPTEISITTPKEASTELSTDATDIGGEAGLESQFEQQRAISTTPTGEILIAPDATTMNLDNAQPTTDDEPSATFANGNERETPADETFSTPFESTATHENNYFDSSDLPISTGISTNNTAGGEDGGEDGDWNDLTMNINERELAGSLSTPDELVTKTAETMKDSKQTALDRGLIQETNAPMEEATTSEPHSQEALPDKDLHLGTHVAYEPPNAVSSPENKTDDVDHAIDTFPRELLAQEQQVFREASSIPLPHGNDEEASSIVIPKEEVLISLSYGPEEETQRSIQDEEVAGRSHVGSGVVLPLTEDNAAASGVQNRNESSIDRSAPAPEEAEDWSLPTKPSKKARKAKEAKAKEANAPVDPWAEPSSSSRKLSVEPVAEADMSEVRSDEASQSRIGTSREVYENDELPAPSKLSKKERKKAKKASTLDSFLPSESREYDPSFSSTAEEMSTQRSEKRDSYSNPLIEVASSFGETQVNNSATVAPAKLSKKEKKKAKRPKAWEEWPADGSQEAPIEESPVDHGPLNEVYEGAVEEPAVESQDPLLDYEHESNRSEERIVPEVTPEFVFPASQPDSLSQELEQEPLGEVSQELSKRNEKKSATARAGEDVPEEVDQVTAFGETVDETRHLEEVQEKTTKEPTVKPASDIISTGEENAVNSQQPEQSSDELEQEPEVEPEWDVPLKLSKKDKKKAKKTKAQDESSEAKSRDKTVEDPEDDSLSASQPLQDDQHLEAEPADKSTLVAADMSQADHAVRGSEPQPEPSPKLSKKDKKKNKKAKAWEEWSLEEDQQKPVEESSTGSRSIMEPLSADHLPDEDQVLDEPTVDSSGSAQQVTEVAPERVPEQTQEAEPKAKSGPETLKKLSKKDNKKAKKAQTWDWEQITPLEDAQVIPGESPAMQQLTSESAHENLQHRDNPVILGEPFEIGGEVKVPRQISQSAREPELEPEHEHEALPKDTSLDAEGTVDIKQESVISRKPSKKEKRKAKKDAGTSSPAGSEPPVLAEPAQDDIADPQPSGNSVYPTSSNRVDAVETPDALLTNDVHGQVQDDYFTPVPPKNKGKKDKKKAKKSELTWDETEPNDDDPFAGTAESSLPSGQRRDEVQANSTLPEDVMKNVPDTLPEQSQMQEATSQPWPEMPQQDPKVLKVQGLNQTSLSLEDASESREDTEQTESERSASKAEQVPDPSKQQDRDIDFAATLAAGLADSGFDPSLVVDDPIFHRRASPPGMAEADPEEAYPAATKKKGKKAKASRTTDQAKSDSLGTEFGKQAQPDSETNTEGAANDDEFSAALSAGLAVSGFASNVFNDRPLDESARVDEPEDFSFAVSKKKKGKKGKKSLPLTPDINESRFDRPASPSLEAETYQESQHSGATADITAIGEAERSLPSLETRPEPVDTVGDDEWALPAKKKGKKGKKAPASLSVDREQEQGPSPEVKSAIVGHEGNSEPHRDDIVSRSIAVPSDTLEAGTDTMQPLLSPSSRIASLFPDLSRVKHRAHSPTTYNQASEPLSASVSEHSVLEKSLAATQASHGDSQSGNVTPIDPGSPLDDQEIPNLEQGSQPNKLDSAHGAKNIQGAQPDPPTWSFVNLHENEVSSPEQYRNSGYHDPEQRERSEPLEAEHVEAHAAHASSQSQQVSRPQSPGDPLQVSIEVNPDWDLPVPRCRTEDQQGSVNRAPSPFEPTTKDRTSYLFNSPPGAGPDADRASTEVTPSIPDADQEPTGPPEEATPYEQYASPIHENRELSNAESREQSVKAAEHDKTPLQSFRERYNTVANEPDPFTSLSQRPSSTRQDDTESRSYWQTTTDEDYADRNLKTRRAVEDLRSISGGSNVSANSVARLTRPSGEQLRSSSANSNRSFDSNVSNRSLRRTDRTLSGDIRAASKRGWTEQPWEWETPGPTTITIEPPPTPPLQEEDENNVHNGLGSARAADMANVFEGWGDARGSPTMSPTRPPSMRKRQSMHIIDLEARLDQLVAENQQLQIARNDAEQSHPHDSSNNDSQDQVIQEALEARDMQIREKEDQIQQLRAILEPLQQEVTRLTELNGELSEQKKNLIDDTNNRYATLQAEHALAHSQWEHSTRQLEQSHQEIDRLRQQHAQLSGGMEDIVRQEIARSLEDKNLEISRLQEDLAAATEQIKALQSQILSSKKDDWLFVRDEDYFDTACQKLCQHVQQWVLRFSKYSDNRMCRLTSDIADEKIEARLDNSILDGTDVDKLLADRVRRRDIFMSIVMSMIWEYVFTRYLFGMDREQRQKLKALEKILADVGPQRAVSQWRATTLTLLARRPAFASQRNLDTEAVAQEIFSVLSTLLPPPTHLETQIMSSLRSVLRLAVDLSIEMRTQRAEYIMLPPLQPEWDPQGDLVRKVHFNASLMNERSGDYNSNDELHRNQAVVKIVLFPLVVKKGTDLGEGEDEIVVCPAQVLVAGSKVGKKVVRVMSGAMDIDEPRRSKQSLVSALDSNVF